MNPVSQKRRRCIGWPAALLILFLALTAQAGSLRDDYRAFVVKRQSLEKKRSEYAVKIKGLTREQRRLTFSLYKCVTTRRGGEWAALLEEAQAQSDKLEEERGAVNAIRESIDSVRRSLEEQRVQIENSHRRKGEGTSYETAFRQYMADLEKTYFDRIKAELFAGYEAYMRHINAHIAYLEDAVARCRDAGAGE